MEKHIYWPILTLQSSWPWLCTRLTLPQLMACGKASCRLSERAPAKTWTCSGLRWTNRRRQRSTAESGERSPMRDQTGAFAGWWLPSWGGPLSCCWPRRPLQNLRSTGNRPPRIWKLSSCIQLPAVSEEEEEEEVQTSLPHKVGCKEKEKRTDTGICKIDCLWCVCVCVCVWEREREREREREYQLQTW